MAAPAFLTEYNAFLFDVGRTSGSVGFAQVNVAWQWEGALELKGPRSSGILGCSCLSSGGWRSHLPLLSPFQLRPLNHPLCSCFFLSNESNAEKSLSRISHFKGSNTLSLFSPLTFFPLNQKRKHTLKVREGKKSCSQVISS